MFGHNICYFTHKVNKMFLICNLFRWRLVELLRSTNWQGLIFKVQEQITIFMLQPGFMYEQVQLVCVQLNLQIPDSCSHYSNLWNRVCSLISISYLIFKYIFTILGLNPGALTQNWIVGSQSHTNGWAIGNRQWPEVYDLCHTFLHVGWARKHTDMRELHAKPRKHTDMRELHWTCENRTCNSRMSCVFSGSRTVQKRVTKSDT